MNNFNYDFITSDLDRPWSFKTSEDGKIALIGFGDDEGQLAQFDIGKKELSKSYWTEGSYTLSIEFLSNKQAIIGTNNGFVIFIDLARKEILNKNKISDKSIKNLKLSNDKTLMFSITPSEVLAFNTKTLELMYKTELDYNPWWITIITDKDLIAIGGSKNTIELLNSKNFEVIDSVICGEEYRDVSSLIYDDKNSLLISGTESGTLDMWKVTMEGLKKEKQLNIGDNILWLQYTDECIAFATMNKSILVYDISEEKLLTVPDAIEEGRFSLKKIGKESYLLYQVKNGGLSLINHTQRSIVLNNPINVSGIKFMGLTVNGDIVGVSSKGVVLSNFIDKEEVSKTEYDFNSKEKNIAVEKFIINDIDKSVLLECKDKTLKVVSLKDKIVSDINFSLTDTFSDTIDFYQEYILLKSHEYFYIINMKNNQIQKISNSGTEFESMKNIKLLSNKNLGVVNNRDYIDYLDIYDFGGNKIKSIKLDNIFGSMFISHSKLVTTSMHNPSEIIDIETNKIKKFDIGYLFGEDDDTMLFDNEKYCIRITITASGEISYEMDCWDLSILDKNNRAKKIWQVEDPSLETFIPLGYCKLDKYFYIVDKNSGEMLSIDINNNGDIINNYQLQRGIKEIKMSNSGDYIAWKLATGEFSYISYPFESCEVSDA